MKCPYCNNSNLEIYFRIEKLPNILSACPKDFLNRIRMFPFEATLCKNCYLGFNSAVLPDAELKFIYDNYLYISPSEGIGSSRYDGIHAVIKEYCNSKEKIVEIGCSEGYLLYRLKSEGYANLIGIEPGPKADIATSLGLTVFKKYFIASDFIDNSVDCFIMNNVFEHLADPFSILEEMKKKLSHSGKIIIEIPYFSGYQHQHLYYLNLSFLKRMCSDKKLKFIQVAIESDMLRIVITHVENNIYEALKIIEDSNEILELVLKQYIDYKNKIIMIKNLLQERRKIYWWGGGSTSVTFLNQIEKDTFDKIELIIIDGDKNKWGMYIPGLNLQVLPFTILANKKIEDIVIASCFENEIIGTLKKNNVIVDHVHTFFY